jgi:hypothetical protein
MTANGSILSRRNVLVGLAGSAAAGAVATTNAGQQEVAAFKQLLWSNKPGRHNVRLATATVDDWSLQVGTKFQASSGHTLRLDDVEQFDHQNTRPKGLRDRAFAAGFSIISGVGTLPNQVLLQVSHPEGGTFEMFMTAGSPDKPQRRIAVFG